VSLHERGVGLCERGEHAKALEAFRHALASFEAHDGARGDLANTLVEMAVVQRARGDLRGALASLVRARDLLRALRGDGDIDRLRARCLSDTGALHVARGELREAGRTYRRALVIAHRSLGPLEQIIALNGIGVVGKYTGRYDEAARAYARALALARRTGDANATVAAIEHNLGGLAHARGDFRRAERHARRAVSLRRSLVGPHHPDLLADEAALAAVLDGLERWDEAETLHRKVVAGLSSVHGRAHTEVGLALANFGAHWQLRGRRRDAKAMLERALRILERALGRLHPSVALTLHNLAAVDRERGGCSA
jgi:tetratricopeptide (TPR) repeat protein